MKLPRKPWWIRFAAALAALVAVLSLSLSALAFTPPPLRGHVVDTAGKLSQRDIDALDAKLEAYRQQSGNAIVVFVIGSLEGEPIEDVGYTVGNAWKVGEKDKDNGVLLLIAPNERKVRIETGRGVGGGLTDLQSNDIIRNVIAPLLQQDRFRDAVDAGTTAIAKALGGEAPMKPSVGRRGPPPRQQPTGIPLPALIALGVVVLLAIVSRTFRQILWWVVTAMLFRGGGGGGGSSGGGGSGYSGGGGSFGGGGSSDDY
jgi:uncharacterized protein